MKDRFRAPRAPSYIGGRRGSQRWRLERDIGRDDLPPVHDRTRCAAGYYGDGCYDCMPPRDMMNPPPAPARVSAFIGDRYISSRTTYYDAPHVDYPTDPPSRSKRMSSINICDRKGCDSIIKDDAAGELLYALNPSMQRTRKELCPDCSRELDQWLSAGPIGPRERSYSEPYDPTKVEADPFAVMDSELLVATLRKMMGEEIRKALPGAPSSTTIPGSVQQ